MRASLDQVFLTPRAGVTEALLVLERETGARERVTLTLPSSDLRHAVELLARQLAYRGDVSGLGRCRLRRERGGALVDDRALRDALCAAFAREQAGARCA